MTNRQVARLPKVFANSLSKDMKLSKTHLIKIIQSDGFLGQLLLPLMKLGLPLMKNVLMLLAKSVLVLLGLTAAASATGAGIYKKISRSGTSG